MAQMIKTLQVRIKDKHARVLCEMAREVNVVWNFCNETSQRAIRERHQFFSGFDLQKLTKGYSKCEGVQIGSSTVQQVCEEYATRRRQFKKTRLNWRVSNRASSKYSLGWIPFKAQALTYKAGQVRFCGVALNVWDSYGLSQCEFRAGSFSEDSRGRWYLNVQVAMPELCGPVPPAPTAVIGIDMGLKECATASDTQKLVGRWYRQEEKRLAKAQRANKKARVRALHAKIANRRKDEMHKFSTAMVKNCGAIFVGDVASSKLVKEKQCMQCHAVSKDTIGPSFKNIAKRWKGKEDAEKTLIATIQKGTADGGGQHWDMKAKMPDASERPLVSDAEAQKIYQWIMRR